MRHRRGRASDRRYQLGAALLVLFCATPALATTSTMKVAGNQAAVGANAGDGTGFEVNAATLTADDGQEAADMNSGTMGGASCGNPSRDQHWFRNFGLDGALGVPADATAITGIIVYLGDLYVDSNTSVPDMYVDLSWDSGQNWTSTCLNIGSSLALSAGVTYVFGNTAQQWGHTWTAAQVRGSALTGLGQPGLVVRTTTAANANTRDFWLGHVAVQVAYTAPTPTVTQTATPWPTGVPTYTPTPVTPATETATPTITPTGPSPTQTAGGPTVTCAPPPVTPTPIVTPSRTVVPGISLDEPGATPTWEPGDTIYQIAYYRYITPTSPPTLSPIPTKTPTGTRTYTPAWTATPSRVPTQTAIPTPSIPAGGVALRSISFPASSWRYDDANCQGPTVQALGGGPRVPVGVCQFSGGGWIEDSIQLGAGMRNAPPSFSLLINTKAPTPTGTFAARVACQCASPGDVIGNGFGAYSAISIPLTGATQHDNLRGQATSVTCSGTCGSYATVFWRLETVTNPQPTLTLLHNVQLTFETTASDYWTP